MNKWVRAWWPYVIIWLIVAMIYLVGAVRQRNVLNLSATAGGQYPYLVYAKGMAEEGWWGHFGDRNRMPVYPALLSLLYVANWDEFVARASWFAIGSSLAALILVGAGAYAALPRLHATAFITIVALTIFSKYASFVQAELLYYALFFVSWLLLCRLSKRPRVREAVLAGTALGICYLTKASALPLLFAFLCAMIAKQIFNTLAVKDATENGTSRTVGDLATLLACFFLVCGPYLKSNYEHFGKLFYNVNSTFFMWCDSWAEAESFATKYKIDQRYPDCPPDEVPSAARYWRTHSGEQILKRLQYGVETITQLLWQESSTKYMVLLAGFCIVMCVFHRFKLREVLEGEWWCVAFTALVILGYELIYVWYAQVVYGERFMLSLMLPCIFSALWILARIESKAAMHVSSPGTVSVAKIFLVSVMAATLVHGAISAAMGPKPDPTFAAFYFNESKARELAGDLHEASKGYQGVLQLDPSFAAAHQSLGMIALRAGKVDEAVERLSRAVALSPSSADARNSLGSALLQTGDVQSATREFEAAVAIDPKMAVAWYNLGGSYSTAGDVEQARRALSVLRTIDERLAKQLADLLHDEH